MAKNQDTDIDKYEQKENKPEPIKYPSIFDNMPVPEISFDTAEDIGEGIDKLSAFIIVCRNEIFARLFQRKKVAIEDEEILSAAQKQLNYMEKTYNQLIRTGRIIDPKKVQVVNNDNSFLNKIKQMESTLGNIVRDMKT